MTDALNKTTTFVYDQLNRRIQGTDPLGHVGTTIYKAANQVVALQGILADPDWDFLAVMLTIVLVVLVILLFLRNFWATFIPAVTVPLALLGSFASMYLLNFSLDNLSLMALTIAVGFVVDDAIVMVEAIWRRIEHGERPFEAALAGLFGTRTVRDRPAVPVLHRRHGVGGRALSRPRRQPVSTNLTA